MAEAVEIWEKPETELLYMFVGWRQWADAGAISSGLPKYIAQENNAKKIGRMSSDGYYLFQIPGTHDLVRPVVKFEDGYPKSLEERRNDFYYTGDEKRGLLIFIGDEPHLDIERYVETLLSTAKSLGVKRIISLGGVYGELPYDKERMISSTYSLPSIRKEMNEMAVNLSDYHGGASIGSYVCKKAGEKDLELVSFYGFVPTYDFSDIAQIGKSIRIENDFMAWLGIMRRVNHMLKTNFDLSDLEKKCERLIETVEAKVEELEIMAPQLGVREYLTRLAEEFEEVTFDPPLGDVWESEINRLFDDDESSS